MQKVNLCPSCAEDKGVTDPTGFSLADSLEGMGVEETTPTEIAPGELVCDACGFTQSDFKKTGRFGCAECYRVFHEGLEGLLEAMHKNTEHRGKIPAHYEATRAHHERMEELRECLETAVRNEEFEEAARLRDEIARLGAENAAAETSGSGTESKS